MIIQNYKNRKKSTRKIDLRLIGELFGMRVPTSLVTILHNRIDFQSDVSRIRYKIPGWSPGLFLGIALYSRESSEKQKISHPLWLSRAISPLQKERENGVPLSSRIRDQSRKWMFVWVLSSNPGLKNSELLL